MDLTPSNRHGPPYLPGTPAVSLPVADPGPTVPDSEPIPGNRAAPRDAASAPSVEIVVLNYNGWPDTLRCLDSLEQLSYPRARIVVVDNHSTDDSVAQLKQRHPELELVDTGTNLGFAGGNNVGIRRAMSRGAAYVWLLNNDATADPESLTALVRTAEADSRVGAVGSVIYEQAIPAQVQARGGGRVCLASGHCRNVRTPDQAPNFITGTSLLLRVRALEDVGLLDERFFFLWEDVDLSLRLTGHGWRLAVAPQARVWHRGGGTEPRISPWRIEHHAAGLVLLMRKHARLPWLSVLPIWSYYAYLSVRHGSPTIIARAMRGWLRGWRL